MLLPLLYAFCRTKSIILYFDDGTERKKKEIHSEFGIGKPESEIFQLSSLDCSLSE